MSQNQDPNLDLSQRWTQHQRSRNKTTISWACCLCHDDKVFYTKDDLWRHASIDHSDSIPSTEEDIPAFREDYESRSSQKQKRTPFKGERQFRKSDIPEAPLAIPIQSKRPLSHATNNVSTGSESALQNLQLNNIQQDDEQASTKAVIESPARKKAALGDGVSAGTPSPKPVRDESPPSRSRARPASASQISPPDFGRHRPAEDDIQRPHVERKSLFDPHQGSTSAGPLLNSPASASSPTQRSRHQNTQNKSRKPLLNTTTRSSGNQRRSILTPDNTSPLPFETTHLSPSPQIQSKSSVYQYDIVPQLETKSIEQTQLVAEVKGIYAGLVMVEAKCIEVDTKQAAEAGSKLNNEQWQALIALHRTLLNEHHDFFQASQHPSASEALRSLASKYAMPARMWRYGIHSFLELLRHRLPASLDHMLAFIYLAYSMMALLYETVEAFKDTWIECLGDLGRYRMAIEDDDLRDREVWTGVARYWYSMASDAAPRTGRLYHHLAILARPNALQQLFYYDKSLCVPTPFTSTRDSILTLFDPIMNAKNSQGQQYRLPPFDKAFVKLHGLLFIPEKMDAEFGDIMNEFLSLLNDQIGRVTSKFKEQGSYIAVANCVALLDFASASKDNRLIHIIAPASADNDVQMTEAASQGASPSFENALLLFNSTLEIVLRRIGDPNVLPFIHVILVFMHHISRYPDAMSVLRPSFPWKSLTTMLNALVTILESSGSRSTDQDLFPAAEDGEQPFPEDFALRGLLWAENYFPANWFDPEKIDDEEKCHELASMTVRRQNRIIRLGIVLSRSFGLDLNHNAEALATKSSEFFHSG